MSVWFLLLPFLTCDRLQVIGQNWHLTHDTWHMDMRPVMWHLTLTRDTSHLTMGWVSGFTVIGACHLSYVRKATARATHPSNVSYITWCLMCLISLDVKRYVSCVKCHMPGVTCQVSPIRLHVRKSNSKIHHCRLVRCQVSFVWCQVSHDR